MCYWVHNSSLRVCTMGSRIGTWRRSSQLGNEGHSGTIQLHVVAILAKLTFLVGHIHGRDILLHDDILHQAVVDVLVPEACCRTARVVLLRQRGTSGAPNIAFHHNDSCRRDAVCPDPQILEAGHSRHMYRYYGLLLL